MPLLCSCLGAVGRIDAIHEVKGKDGVGATMDSMELERCVLICSLQTNVREALSSERVISTAPL